MFLKHTQLAPYSITINIIRFTRNNSFQPSAQLTLLHGPISEPAQTKWVRLPETLSINT